MSKFFLMNSEYQTPPPSSRYSSKGSGDICLFVCFVALRPKSIAMVMVGRSVHLTTLFSWASLIRQLTSTSCAYFRLYEGGIKSNATNDVI